MNKYLDFMLLSFPPLLLLNPKIIILKAKIPRL